MLQLVNIDDARPEGWNLHTLDFVKVSLCSGRLELSEMPCYVLPNLAWRLSDHTRHNLILGADNFVVWNVLTVSVGPKWREFWFQGPRP